jgi:hypothetical protein
VLVILAHQRRRVVHVAVTGHPTAAWTAQQLREAFPGDEVPRYLIRDRDHAFAGIGPTATGMGIHEVLTAPRSPWQNAYAERVIGSIRRECLDHVIVVNETGLSRLLTWYLTYYHQSRTHLSLGRDSPDPVRSRHQRAARWWSVRRSAVYTIATTAERRNHKAPLLASQRCRNRSALVSALTIRARRSGPHEPSAPTRNDGTGQSTAPYVLSDTTSIRTRGWSSW